MLFASVALLTPLLTLNVFAQVPPERKAPAIYHEAIAPLLTPLEDVLAGRDHHPDTDQNGLTLLAETIHYRADNGTTYRVYHDIYYARTEGAIEALGSNTYSYDKTRESLFLIDAATILPDGTRREIDTRGAFLQAPQHEAANSLYTSEEELTVIFPMVSAGAVTSTIVLVREDDPVFPGEFAASMSFQSGWERFRSRLVLDFPTADLDRVHALAAHPDVPTPTDERDYAAGRSRRTWARGPSPDMDWESRSPAFSFRAPTVWLSTLESWDEVAAWFDGLLQDRSQIGPELTTLLAEWTDDLTDDDAIIRTLFDHVSNDVRYTGLEFGLAGYQPYDCAEVWANRYGDCKDKANLLRALLAAKGIESHIVLLRTTNHGRVERRSPSWHQFNHAILAVPRADGSIWFLDPTVDQLDPTFLPLADSAREVLMLADGKAVWVRTPTSNDSGIHISAEASLNEQAELSGWFTFAATGSDAAFYAGYYNARDTQRRRSGLSDDVQAFFPGSETLDLDYTPTQGPVGDFAIRGYFVRPSPGSENLTVQFPFPVHWLPDLDADDDRTYPYFTYTRTESLTARITLPPNLHAGQIPEPFEVNSDSISISARWEKRPGELAMQLRWQPQRPIIAPDDYPVFHRAIRALTAWLDRPATLTREAPSETDATDADAVATETLSTADFPLLATGGGQMRLLENRYPEGRDDLRRRLALQRIIQWFPDEPETAFDATVYLALLDADGTWDETFIAKLRDVLQRFGASAPPSSLNWGRYLLGRALWSNAKDPEGIRILLDVADDTQASPYRRGWCAYYAGAFQSENDPAAARETFARFADINSDAQLAIIKYHARLLVELADASATQAWLEQLPNQVGPENTPGVLDQVFDYLSTSIPTEQHEALTAFATLATATLPDANPSDETNSPGLAALIRRLEADDAWREYYLALQELVETSSSLDWLAVGDASTWADFAAVEAELERANDAREGVAVINAALNLALYHNDNKEAVAQYTRWALWWLRSSRQDDAFLRRLGDIAVLMPASEDNTEVVSAWDELGDGLVALDDLDAAIRVHQLIVDDPGTQPYQLAEAHAKLTQIALQRRAYGEALEQVRLLAPVQGRNTDGGDFLFPGIMLSLRKHDYDQAMAWLQDVSEIEEQYREKLDLAPIYTDTLPFVTDHPEELRRYWTWAAEWQNAWRNQLAELSEGELTPVPVPDLTDLKGLGTQAANAIEARDTTALLRVFDTFVSLMHLTPFGTQLVVNTMEETAEPMPELNRALREWFLSVVRTMPDTGTQVDELMSRRTGLLLFQLGHFDQVPDWVEKVLNRFGADTAEAHYAALIWLNATRETPEDKESLTFAQAVLQQEDVEFRDGIVAQMHDRLLALGRSQERLDLIMRELEEPRVQANAGLVKALRQQRDILHRSLSQGAALTEWVDQWVAANNFQWLDRLEPATLDEPGVREPSDDGYYEWNDDGYGRTVRLNYLQARSPAPTTQVRLAAFRQLVSLLVAFDEAPDFAAKIKSALDSDLWPLDERVPLVSYGSARLSGAGFSAQAREIVELPANTGLPERFTDLLAFAQNAGETLALREPDAIAAAIEALLDHPLEEGEPEIIELQLKRLVYLDADPLVDAFLAAAKQLEVGSTVSNTSAALRLQWLRSVRTARTERPFFHALRDRLTSVLLTDETDRANLGRMLGSLSFYELGHTQRARAVTLALAEAAFNGVDHTDLLNVLSSCHMLVVPHPDLSLPLIEFLLSSDIEDSRRSQFLWNLNGLVDPDIDRVYHANRAVLQTFLAEAPRDKLPLTRASVRRLLAIMDLRRSLEAQPDTLFTAEAREEIGTVDTDAFQLQFLVTRGRYDEAYTVLNRMDPDILTQLHNFPFTRQVLIAVDAADELELMQEVALERFLKARHDVFSLVDMSSIYSFLQCVDFLGQEATLEDWFWERLLTVIKDVDDQAFIRMHRDYFAADWEELLAVSDATVARQPEGYSAIGFRGVAHFHLGHYAEAVADLELYLERDLTSPRRAARAELLARAREHL
ncbi:DUF3857 domain-containing protein [Actomonas aquatica]|uniref:DUF3857 domain-containing protein n=1 Tax=Actomonas aquatica TaxID=2866162 RepID=A0ABZ1C959_9BACT|nr:DUF3857 domain-containing protein [Opitutus sp. WL0086]WRQ87788.1 DUF3857 domain-containing protein [Opitutus sp. WL0086]